MSQETIRCTEPSIYTAHPAGTPFEEGRAVLLGRYAEKELEAPLETIVREHLDRCACCTLFLKQLLEAYEAGDTFIAHASCPSSQNLDRYVFRVQELPQAEQNKIQQHLVECPLCKQESDWLRTLDPVEPLPAIRTNWVRYGAIAATIVFALLALFFFQERVSLKNTEAQLRALAVVKTPDQINYAALRTFSAPIPENMDDVYEKGVEALKQEKYQEAIRHLELVATAHPDHSASLYLLGYCYYQMKEHEKAFDLCDRAEKMQPHSMERCLLLVHIALKTGHFKRAMDEISGLHHDAPDHPEVKEMYERITSITRGRTVKL